MAVAIAAEGLSKRYRIGELKAAYGTLRERSPIRLRGSPGGSTTSRTRSGRFATSASR